MANANLNVILNGKVVFQSDKRWLHPLFDFEEFLKNHSIEMSHAEVHDKVIGKAAAMLIVRMGASSAHGDVMSELGRAVFLQAGIPHTYRTLVARIDCQTEELLLEVNDLERAHQLLMVRAGRSKTEDPDC